MKFLRTRIVLKIAFVISIGLMLGYFVIPRLLMYPEYSHSISFQKSVENYSQIEQYISLGTVSIIVISLIILWSFRNVFRVNKDSLDEDDVIKIQEAAHVSNTRVTLYFLFVYFPIIVVYPLLIPQEFPRITVYFVALATFSWVAVVAIVFSFWVKQELVHVVKNMLQKTKNYNLYSRKNNLTSNIIVTLFMMTIILFMFLFLYGYSTAAARLGETKSKYYSNIEPDFESRNIVELESNLKKVDLLQPTDHYFIIKSNGNIVTNGPELTKFMVQYIKQFSNKTNTAYNSYVYTDQAYFKKGTDNNGGRVYYGHIFEVKDASLLTTLANTLFVALLIYILILWYWSSNIIKPIKDVATSLSLISSDKNVDYEEKLPIFYNDEIGQIVDSYNKIQDLTKKYIDSINEKQDIMIKQEQLVTLGELAGGMAHDINTPIAAINYGVDVLSKQVTDEKQLEIIKTMKECSLKIITIVNDLRNQIRNLGTNDMTWFKLATIVKESEVLVHNKLVKSGCELVIEIDPNLELYGERNKLSQVITNMIVNAIQAYEKINISPKIITVQAWQDGDNAIIRVIDKADGIPETMREAMFKEIMTTKGSEGTGIGMYLAYSVIRSVFKGNLTFETATGQGTTFIIVIPNNSEKIENISA